jgi:NAD(P)-dependent dehydrogenase (short-subunit alcohol dehydrogenase family)
VDNSSHDSGAPLNWFITGAGSGLGRAITELALAEGDSVVATDLRTDALAELGEQHGRRKWITSYRRCCTDRSVTFDALPN